jgi:FkbM family methyltransferase
VNFYGQFDPPVDRLLYERYFHGRPHPGVAIECGAFDGITESSCKFFEESLGWTCINIEPYPLSYDKLVVNRPSATNLNAALSNVTGTAEFTAVMHPVFGADCNNGSLGHTSQHRENLDRIGCTYRNYRVATTTYAELVVGQHLTSVDLFVLDVEGHEREVLDGMRSTPPALLPAIFCIEHGHLGVDALKPLVEGLGYAFDTTSFVNSLYVRNDLAAVFFALRDAPPGLAWKDARARARACPVPRRLLGGNGRSRPAKQFTQLEVYGSTASAEAEARPCQRSRVETGHGLVSLHRPQRAVSHGCRDWRRCHTMSS